MAANVTGSWASTLMSIGAAALLASPIVVAQTQESASDGSQLPQVQVEAEGTVVEKTPLEGQPPPVGQAGAAGTMERVTMTRKINTADLDLSTPQGVRALNERIEATAKSECNEIRSLSGPLTSQAQGAHVNDKDNCVNAAVTAARKQAQMVVAAAEEKKRRG